MDNREMGVVSTAATWKFEVKTGDLFWFLHGNGDGAELVTVGDDGRFYTLILGSEFAFDAPGVIHTIEIPR